MAEPLAVIIRFSGDPDDLLERFELARRMWIEAQEEEYERPVFYAACRTDEGIDRLGLGLQRQAGALDEYDLHPFGQLPGPLSDQDLVAGLALSPIPTGSSDRCDGEKTWRSPA